MQAKATVAGAAAAIALALALAIVVALNPVVYDTMHVNDTTFMLQVASWVRDGDVPGVDFPHFYGGFHEAFVALGLDISGGNGKALDYARVLQFAVMAMLVGLVSWRRLDTLTSSFLVLLLAIVLFAALPMEERAYVSVVDIEAAHSFAYNRWGTCLVLICAAVLIRRSYDRFAEIAGGAIAGFAAMAAILTKITFFPIVFAMILGFAITGRWKPLIAFLLAAAATGVAFDPTGARTFGVLAYSMDSTATSGSESWMVRKAFQLVFSHNVEVLAFLLVFALTLFTKPRREALGLIANGLLLLAAFWATAVTMGPAGLVGHQAMPFIVGLMLLVMPDLAKPEIKRIAVALLAVVSLAFAGPHVLNFAAANLAAVRNADEVAFSSGPLAGYLARGEWRATNDGTVVSARNDPAGAAEATAERLSKSKAPIDATSHYVLLYDAVALLDGLSVPDGYGVVSDTALGIGFAVGADRAEGFPAWPRSTSPEFRDGSDPLRRASLALVMRPRKTDVRSAMTPHLNSGKFVLCRESELWRVYALRSHHEDKCTLSR